MTDYHQESGRAGRQGEASTATTIVTEDKLRRLAPYLETPDNKGEMHALTRRRRHVGRSPFRLSST